MRKQDIDMFFEVEETAADLQLQIMTKHQRKWNKII